jgi:transcriptional regulator with XRE-family HTH domain
LHGEHRKTQQQIATALGIGIEAYRKIEKGEKQASKEQVTCVAKILQTDKKNF